MGIDYVDWRVKWRADGTLVYANAMWLDGRGTPVAAPAPIVKAPVLGGGSDEQKPPSPEAANDPEPAASAADAGRPR
jgi:hypothetical protein